VRSKSSALPPRALEPLVLGFGLALAVGAYACLARFGVDLADEGYFMDLGTRVMNGQLPYRDFDTYYTPAIFYVYSVVFNLFGATVLSARWLMIATRIACGVLLYVLARRVAPYPFAVLAPLVMVLGDLSVQSHPAWPALLGTLLMLELLARYDTADADPEPGRDKRFRLAVFLGLAGASAALAFAFKQNVGAFAVLGGLGYVLLRPRPRAGLLVLLVGVPYSVSLALVVRLFLASSLNDLFSVTIWLPIVATLLLLLVWSAGAAWRFDLRHPFEGVRDVARDTAWFGVGFVLVTVAWLGPLVTALGVSATPLGLFLGDVNSGALYFVLPTPPQSMHYLAFIALALPLLVAALFRPPMRRLVAPAAVTILAIPFASLLAITELTLPVGGLRGPEWLMREFRDLHFYLPALAAWFAWLLLAARWSGGARPPLVAWYLLVGTLAQLAIFPRADSVHALYAGTLLLPVGAWALAGAHHRLAARISQPGQLMVFGALMLVPVVAIAPLVYSRVTGLARPDPDVPTNYVEFELERAPVLVHQPLAEDLRDAIRFVQAGTPPGHPLFAYPVDPMANVLADRPNPTRFDHLMPGALTPRDMREVIASLERARPRYILWDQLFVGYWNVNQSNRPLNDFIWQCYWHVASFRRFLVLEWHGC
jgi:hypothetical protein